MCPSLYTCLAPPCVFENTLVQVTSKSAGASAAHKCMMRQPRIGKFVIKARHALWRLLSAVMRRPRVGYTSTGCGRFGVWSQWLHRWVGRNAADYARTFKAHCALHQEYPSVFVPGITRESLAFIDNFQYLSVDYYFQFSVDCFQDRQPIKLCKYLHWCRVRLHRILPDLSKQQKSASRASKESWSSQSRFCFVAAIIAVSCQIAVIVLAVVSAFTVIISLDAAAIAIVALPVAVGNAAF